MRRRLTVVRSRHGSIISPNTTPAPIYPSPVTQIKRAGSCKVPDRGGFGVLKTGHHPAVNEASDAREGWARLEALYVGEGAEGAFEVPLEEGCCDPGGVAPLPSQARIGDHPVSRQ